MSAKCVGGVHWVSPSHVFQPDPAYLCFGERKFCWVLFSPLLFFRGLLSGKFKGSTLDNLSNKLCVLPLPFFFFNIIEQSYLKIDYLLFFLTGCHFRIIFFPSVEFCRC